MILVRFFLGQELQALQRQRFRCRYRSA